MINPFATETELKILALLRGNKELYGMQIVEQGKLKRGTVYVTLGRLEDRNLVEARLDRKAKHPGMPRPLYSLTEAGERMLQAWSAVNQSGNER